MQHKQQNLAPQPQETSVSQNLLKKIHAKKALIDRAERPRMIEFFQGNIVRWLLLANVILLIGISVSIAYFMQPRDHQIILQYNAFFGISSNMFGQWWYAYGVVAFAASIFLVNTILAIILWRSRERIASYILLLGSLLVQCSVTIVTIAIIIVNR